MTQREIVLRVIGYDAPPRLAYDFSRGNPSDILHIASARLSHPDASLSAFGEHAELLAKVPWFRGEVRLDNYGNIYGRLGGKTKGECVKGVLEDDFNAVADYQMPDIDCSYFDELKSKELKKQEKFVLAGMPVAIFSTLRDMRLMSNALADTALDPENIALLMQKITQIQVEIVNRAAECGVDGIMIGDDWGTQDRLFISPRSFRELFKPVYAALGDAIHAHKMKYFMHSCGYVSEIIDDLIEAGVDVFQFDQPELLGSDVLAKRLKGRAALYSPVDIQKVMSTGDRAFIEGTAKKMTGAFRETGGGLIMKDYPTWHDVGVSEEWANWARDEMIKGSMLHSE